MNKSFLFADFSTTWKARIDLNYILLNVCNFFAFHKIYFAKRVSFIIECKDIVYNCDDNNISFPHFYKSYSCKFAEQNGC